MTLEDQFALWLEPSRRRLYSEFFIDRWDEDRQVEMEIEQPAKRERHSADHCGPG